MIADNREGRQWEILTDRCAMVDLAFRTMIALNALRLFDIYANACLVTPNAAEVATNHESVFTR